MRTVILAVVATLLLAGCGGSTKASTATSTDPTADYLSVLHAAEGAASGTDRTDPANPYNATMDKADLKIAHTACDALDAKPDKATYSALINAATSDNAAMAKLRIDAAIGAFCPSHLNLKG